MSNPDDPRLDTATRLTPGNAVAALVLVGGRYLLQLRDNKHGIFFPAHWGCFGGAAEAGETPEAALARELNEELDLVIPAAAFRYLTRFDFDLAFAGRGAIWRYFYEVELAAAGMAQLRLQEGSDMRLFGAEEILLGTVPLTPYDAFALWLHINRSRLQG